MKENPLKLEKQKKLQTLKDAGIDPFPHNFLKTHTAQEVLDKHNTIETGESLKETSFVLAGRVMTKRNMGKAAFFNIQDDSGKIQIYLRINELEPTNSINLDSEKQQISFKNLDIGDIVGVQGYAFKTKKGELSIYAKSFQILCKSLEPLPEKFHGLTDIELKYRYRHLDLIMNAESKKVFKTRSKIIKEVRNFLDDRGFLEVETPVLQPIYGGAAAKPFSTHHNTLDMELFLKISPELYLKRLVVGGFEKVYEIGKNFRNEGMDRTHNPEFTMLEYYEAYTDYNDQMKQFEDLVSTVVKKITGSYKVMFQDKEIDFTPPWSRLTVHEGIQKYAGFNPDDLSDIDLFTKIKSLGSDLKKGMSRGHMIMAAFEITTEEHLWQPTFIMDFPMSVSPLTKKHRSKKDIVERFEPMVACMELGNSYTELNDPEDQLARLKEQEASRLVDDQAQPMDKDFLHAIEVGMPPTGGVGIGIERLVMLITGQSSIRDILLFPTMKKHS